jgi:hypothetical protein
MERDLPNYFRVHVGVAFLAVWLPVLGQLMTEILLIAMRFRRSIVSPVQFAEAQTHKCWVQPFAMLPNLVVATVGRHSQLILDRVSQPHGESASVEISWPTDERLRALGYSD